MASRRWLKTFLVAAAAVLLLLRLQRSYWAEAFLPLIGAIWLLLVIYTLGTIIARRLAPDADDLLTRLGLGIMATTFFFLVVGMSRALRPPLILAYLAIPLAWAPFLLASAEERKKFREPLAAFFSRPVWEWLFCCIPLFYAALPSTFFDTLVYHLSIPNLYLQHGAIVPTPQFLYANASIYYEIALVPALWLSELTPGILHCLLGTIMIFGLVDWARSTFGLSKRWPLLLAAFTLPMSMFLLATIKNDLASAFFILLAMRHWEGKRHSFSALFWGYAIGAKYINLLPLTIFLPMVLFRGRKPALKKLPLFFFIVLLVLLPLFAKNILFCHNPVFPFFPNQFHTPFWDQARFAVLKKDVGQISRTAVDLLRLPYDLSFREYGTGGMIGIGFLALLPMLLLVRGIRLDWLAFSLVTIAAATFFTSSLRFIWIAFLLLSVYLAVVYERAPGRWVRAIFLAIAAFNVVTGTVVLELVYCGRNVSMGSIESYKVRLIHNYDAFTFINERTGPREQVMFVGETRSLYLHRPYQVSSPLDYALVKKYLAASESAEAFRCALRDDGYSYILFDHQEWRRLLPVYHGLTAQEESKMMRFFQRLAVAFRSENTYVFALNRTAK